MKNKRALSLLLAVMILLSSLPFAGVTAFADTSGDFEYELIENGTVEIVKYTGSASSVTIPSKIGGYPVTKIGKSAFSFCDTLTSITIPNSVEHIGDYAFWYCDNLKNVNIPDGVKSIGDNAFESCYSLTSLTISDSVTAIGNSAFANCENLTNLSIGAGVLQIGDYAFYFCQKIKNVTLPNKLTTIGEGAFKNCENITAIKIPSSVTSISDMAFSGCSKVASISIPNSIVSIGDNAFASCYGVTSIVIPDSVKSIGACAFQLCSKLKDIKISDSVISIGEGAFGGTSYYYNKSNWDNHALYIGKHLVEINNSLSGAYSVKSGTISIADETFYDCTFLTSVTLPNSVKSIGELTFYNCFNLTELTLGNSIISIGDYAFTNCGMTSLTLPTSVKNIGDHAFNSCRALKDVYYKGSKAQWNKVSLGTGTDRLAKAKMHYNSLDTPKIYSAVSTATGIQLKWKAVSGAEMYRVFYKKNNESSWHNAGDTNTTTFNWTGAKSGYTYNFTVRCLSEDGKTYRSAYYPAGIDLDYTAAPKLSSVSNTATGVQFKWGEVYGAAKYRIFYKANDESTWHKIADITSTSYSWTKAKSGTKYTFTVRCVSKDGKDFTSAYDTKGKSITYIAAPKLSKVENTATGVKITWAKSTGAEKYRVFYKTGSSGWKQIGDTTSTSYTWKGAKSGTKYTFTVRCVSKDGKSYTSAFDSKGKTITFLSAPKISSLSKTSSGIQIKWGKVTGAVNYKVFRKTAGGSWTAIGTTTGTSFVDKTAKKGTKYTYTVRCVSKDGKTYTSGFDAKGKSITR